MSVMPFSGFVGLEDLKETLLTLAVDPSIGGLLILGPKGTGKSSLVRAFAEVLPDIEVVVGCNFGCWPQRTEELCSECSTKLKENGQLPSVIRKMKIVELPIGVTDDRVVGSINIERTLKDGKIHFEPGLLARAHRNILYIDEVNLLPDHIVDLILDAAAYGWNIVEREGVSLKHPARFILVGTMNPEEGELRPQLLDRFAVSVPIQTVLEPQLRAEIVRRNIEFETNQELFTASWLSSNTKLSSQIENARKHMREINLPNHVIASISQVCGRLSVDGYRPDIVAAKVARALTALDGRYEVTPDDALQGLRLALGHRTRSGGLKPPASPADIDKLFQDAKSLQLTRVTQSKIETTEKNASPPHESQRKNSVAEFFNRVRPKRERDQNQDQEANSPRNGRSKAMRLLGIIFTASMLVAFSLLSDLRTFLLMTGLMILIFFIFSLLRRSKGPLEQYQQRSKSQTRKSSRGKMMSVLTFFSWPTARKVLGKRVSEGERLIEQSGPEESAGQRLELNKILTKARWLGRRKSRTGWGRPVSYRIPTDYSSDIAIATSLRLAARGGKPLQIHSEDLRTNIREGRIRASMILVLDSSESMIDSLSKVRDAIRVVKKGAARMRDRVGLIVFKGEEAHVLQHSTTNFNLVMQKLGSVGLSDFTPLAAGAQRAIQMARTEQARGYAPLIIVASDGVTNVSTPHGGKRMMDIPDPATDALHMARVISANKWKAVFANMAHVTEDGPADMIMGTQLMLQMAEVTKGIYVGFNHRDGETVIRDFTDSKQLSREELMKIRETVSERIA